MIKFRVNGLPAPQGSKTRNRAGALYESSRAVGPWREAVRAETPAHRTEWAAAQCALSVTITFVLPRPKSHYSYSKGRVLVDSHRAAVPRPSAPRYPAKRPDLDKLTRAVLDGLVAGGMMADDSQVVSLSCTKVYARNGEAPGAMIEVEAL